MNTAIQVTDVLVVISSIIAAAYWFLSSMVKVPSYSSPGLSPNMKNARAFLMIEKIAQAMTRQSMLSSRGAIAAGLAAVLTGVSSALRVFVGL
jgi:hypothetical protein